MDVRSEVGSAPITIKIVLTDPYEKWAMKKACEWSTKDGMIAALHAGDMKCPDAAACLLHNLHEQIRLSLAAAGIE